MVLLVVLEQLSTSRVCCSETVDQIFSCLGEFMRGVLDVEKFVMRDINGCTLLKPVAWCRIAYGDGKLIQAGNDVSDL